jgi:hypothetical protein
MKKEILAGVIENLLSHDILPFGKNRAFRFYGSEIIGKGKFPEKISRFPTDLYLAAILNYYQAFPDFVNHERGLALTPFSIYS